MGVHLFSRASSATRANHSTVEYLNHSDTRCYIKYVLYMAGLCFLNMYDEIINTVMLRLYMFIFNLCMKTTLETIHLIHCRKTFNKINFL